MIRREFITLLPKTGVVNLRARMRGWRVGVSPPRLELAFDDVMEELFGLDPALHDDRRTGFKLP